MDNIHAPTVPSGSRTNGVNGHEPTTYPELVAEKERIEAELRALSSVLDSVGIQVSNRDNV
jgi:26S proteasome non-ATPase regulatory subunit 9